jgi:hypothetical protein
MKWFLFIAAIALLILAYNQQRALDATKAELFQAQTKVAELERMVPARGRTPGNPFRTGPPSPPGQQQSNDSILGKAGNPLDTSPQGNQGGGNPGGGKGRR